MTQFTRVVNGRTELTASLFNDLQEAIEQLSFNVMRYGAVGDGVTDDTVAWAAVYAAAPAGNTIYFPDGTYLMDSLVISKKVHLHLSNGATIKLRSPTDDHVISVSASGVNIVGGSLDGNATTGRGISITASDCTVNGVTIANTGTCVASNASRTSVRNCTLSSSTGWGVELNVTSYSTIADCVIEGNYVDLTDATAATTTAKGIGLVGDSGNSDYVNRTRISNNTIALVTSPTLGTPICIEAWGGTPYTVITGNVMVGGAMGVSAADADYSVVTGNGIYAPNLYGIENASSSGVAITGNTIHGDSVTSIGIAVSGTDPDECTITGNTIDGTARGIQISSSENIAVSGNSVAAVSIYGIEVISSDGVAIASNVILGNGTGLKAIVINESSTVSVTGNIVKDWTEHGIMAFGDSAVTLDYIVISGNVFDTCNVVYQEVISGGAAMGDNVFVITSYQGSAFTPSNVSTDRSFDADNTTTAELADVLGTLIGDLQALGIVQ